MVLHNSEERSHLNTPIQSISVLINAQQCNARERLFVELPVLILPEQSLSNSGESIALEQFQSFFEGVIDVNLASPTHN
jgi:hypothetical protein